MLIRGAACSEVSVKYTVGQKIKIIEFESLYLNRDNENGFWVDRLPNQQINTSSGKQNRGRQKKG